MHIWWCSKLSDRMGFIFTGYNLSVRTFVGEKTVCKNICSSRRNRVWLFFETILVAPEIASGKSNDGLISDHIWLSNNICNFCYCDGGEWSCCPASRIWLQHTIRAAPCLTKRIFISEVPFTVTARVPIWIHTFSRSYQNQWGGMASE